MRSVTTYVVACVLFIAIGVAFDGASDAIAAGGNTQSWDLSGVKEIDIDGVSGDVVIVPTDEGKGSIELRSDVHPQDAFEPVVNRRGSDLRISEKFHGNSSGPIRWTIHLPKTEKAPWIRISNASGNLECADIAVGISYRTASGDVELSSVTLQADSKFESASGDFTIRGMTVNEDSRFNTASGDLVLEDLIIENDARFSTASGDIRIAGCTSGDDVSYSSASGDVEVRSIELAGESTFSSASGDVEVRFDRLSKTGFTASSASGDVTLKVNEFGDDFTLVMIKRKTKGKISCPFDYTDQGEFEEHGQTYQSKIVKRGSGKPVITLRTASGKVTVKD
ncbi:MAG: DUF4097 domain-containing protein [Candidatus Krumholzibacteria bacterium]|nr:DUF4097 domain-containing protein [Candidatus Krumholzibacteria bacterium]